VSAALVHRRDNDRRPKPIAVDIAGRVAPHNEDAETAVLSAVLTDSRALETTLPVLPDGLAFYGDAHRRIYEAAIAVHRRGRPVDVQTVFAELKDREQVQAIGGIEYLARLIDASPSVAHVAAHADIVREKWRMRRGLEVMQLAVGEGYTADYGDTQTFLDGVVSKISDVADDVTDRKDAALLYDVVVSEMAKFDGEPQHGVMTGFVDVDERTTGMHDGELIIVGARPGMGKTSYVLNIATNVAMSAKDDDAATKLGAMVFSLEMPKDQCGMRLLCTEARVGLQSYRKRTLTAGEHDRLVGAADRLSQLPIWVDDTPAITLAEVRAKVRKQQHAFNRRAPTVDGVPGRWISRLGLVVVDYLQLMREPGTESREQEIGTISRGLKALAKELSVPVIALAQLNRAVETRSSKDKRPQLADLRESGSIEQDADVIQFLYRPEYYVADKESAEAQKLKGYAEVIIAKQRNGPTGRVKITFVDEYARFENRSKDAWSDGGDDD
jgi:replicative DNA helicase